MHYAPLIFAQRLRAGESPSWGTLGPAGTARALLVLSTVPSSSGTRGPSRSKLMVSLSNYERSGRSPTVQNVYEGARCHHDLPHFIQCQLRGTLGNRCHSSCLTGREAEAQGSHDTHPSSHGLWRRASLYLFRVCLPARPWARKPHPLHLLLSPVGPGPRA